MAAVDWEGEAHRLHSLLRLKTQENERLRQQIAYLCSQYNIQDSDLLIEDVNETINANEINEQNQKSNQNGQPTRTEKLTYNALFPNSPSIPLSPMMSQVIAERKPKADLLDSQTDPLDSEWNGIDQMIESIMDIDEGRNHATSVSEPSSYDSIDDTLDQMDGVMMPRKLTSIVRTTSVEIARVDELMNLEEKMLDNLHDALSSNISSKLQNLEFNENETTGDEEGEVEEEQTIQDNDNDKEEMTSRSQRSSGVNQISKIRRPASSRNSLVVSNFSSSRPGSRRTSSTSGAPPYWLIYNWLSPVPSSFTYQTKILCAICKVRTALTEVLFMNNFEVVKLACKTVPVTEVDEFSKHILRVFEATKTSFELIESLIKYEIAENSSNTTLLRSNTITSKLLTVYSRMAGKQYLINTIGPFMKQFRSIGSMEVDPTKLEEGEDLQTNIQRLTSAASELLLALTSSLDDCPLSFRRICKVLFDNTNLKFPGHGAMAVGGFIFLRFFCPVIVAPEAFGLLKKSPNQNERRSLVLISKVLQNLANGAKFGTKELYMLPMNDFIEQYTPSLTRFLQSLATIPNNGKEINITIPAAMIEESLSRVASIIETFLDKIAQKLRTTLITQTITHSMADGLALVLRDFPLKEDQPDKLLNDFSLLSRFEELLQAKNFIILSSLLRVVSNSSKEAEIISRASIQILAPHQLAMSFVLTVTESELTPIDNPIRITDSISLGFRLAAAYLHTFGFGYLKKTLSEVINEVCQSDSGFEVDPNYASGTDNIHANMDSLVMASYKFVGCIVNSLHYCPGIIRKICHEMYNMIKTKSNKKMAISVVTQLLFIRFFCPAIASPESYSLCDQPPNKKSHRALVLISYCLKHLACGTVFKDVYMSEMNSFIRDHTELIQEFISKICTLSVKRESILEPSISFEQRSQSLGSIRTLMTPDTLAKMNAYFLKEAVTESVTYKLIDRLAAVLADRYKHKIL